MNQKNILLVIDNRKDEINFQSYFKASNCSIKIAKEINDFRHYIKNALIDFVIIDSSMKIYGNELVKIIDSSKKPYVYLGENDQDLFLDKKISKPYSFSSVFEKLKESLPYIEINNEKGEEFLSTNQYNSIKIEDVINLKIAPFDYFLKINESKFLKIAKEGVMVPTELLSNIKNKGVYIIYCKREDYQKFLDKMTQSSLNLNKMNLPKEVKMKFLSKTSDMIMDNIISEGISKESFISSKQILDASMGIISENDDVFFLLKSLNDLDENSYRHTLAVAMYSILIAKQMRFETEATIFKITMGALFSDIGLKTLPDQVVKNAHVWINGEDLKIYKTHPTISAEFLRKSKDIDESVIQIVEQHHENLDGTGYPKGLTTQQISPLAKLVRVSEEFCQFALKSDFNPCPDSPEIIIENMINGSRKKLEPKFVLALGRVFNLNMEKYTSKLSA